MSLFITYLKPSLTVGVSTIYGVAEDFPEMHLTGTETFDVTKKRMQLFSDALTCIQVFPEVH